MENQAHTLDLFMQKGANRMYIGYQEEKIKFYVQEIKNPEFYPDVIWEETQQEYVLDGEEYVLKNEAWEERQKQKERERINMLSLTKREVFLALYKAKGITPEQIKSQITEPETLIEFEYANEYYRGNPLIDEIGEKLGYTQSDLDYLFENKELPEKTLDNVIKATEEAGLYTLPAEALEAEADQAEDLTPSAVNKKDLEKE